MEFERKVRKLGHSLSIVIPTDLVKYLDLEQDNDLIISEQTGKHGPFLAIWKKEQEQEQEIKEEETDTNDNPPDTEPTE